eukprot:108743-Chlamydomonas_euryale.AAC.1
MLGGSADRKACRRSQRHDMRGARQGVLHVKPACMHAAGSIRASCGVLHVKPACVHAAGSIHASYGVLHVKPASVHAAGSIH